MLCYHGTMSLHLRISLKNLRHNFLAVQQCARSAAICASVKSNAYGHGLVPCARVLADCGAAYLGIASVQEALALRRAGISTPLLLYGMAEKNDLRLAFEHPLLVKKTTSRIEFFAGDALYLAEISRAAKKRGMRAAVHAKCDTGMGRLGSLPADFADLLARALSDKNIILRGICSHLSDSANDEAVRRQLDVFSGALKRGGALPRTDGTKTKILAHIANSGAVFWQPAARFDMVRPGIALYGASPDPGRQLPPNITLRPVMRCAARVAAVRFVPKGRGISYLSEYKTTADTHIAVIGAGYGDGIPLALSGRGGVWIRGARYPIAGRVCMDMLMVDLGLGLGASGTRSTPVRRGDEAVLWGEGDATAEEQARSAHSISYELLCNAGNAPRTTIEYIS